MRGETSAYGGFPAVGNWLSRWGSPRPRGVALGTAHQNPDLVGSTHPTYISKIKYDSYIASIDIFNPVYGFWGMWFIPVSLNNATDTWCKGTALPCPYKVFICSNHFCNGIRRFASLKYLFNTANNLELVYCQMATFAVE